MSLKSAKGDVIYPSLAGLADIDKFIFIHVPKTGGTSIRSSLLKLGKTTNVSHTSVMSYITHYGEDIFKKVPGYAVVRNPLDRIVSSFFFGKAQARCNKNMPEARSRLINASDNFVTFCRGLRRSSESLLIVKSQYKYICDENGNIPIDIYPLECINELWSSLTENYFGCETKLAHINKSSHGYFMDYHTDETIDIVSKMYAYDLEIYERAMEKKYFYKKLYDNP